MSSTTLSQQAWQWLDRELQRWREAGLVASFWWRDDDAVRPGATLDRLISISSAFDLPLSLAVIPAGLEPELAACLRDAPLVTAMQHGFDHRNHAPAGELKREIGGNRQRSRLLADLASGYAILERSFGDRFVPVLVPPWNRIDSDLLPALGGIGFRGISTSKARHGPHPAPDLLQINTHLDPIAWRQGGGFLGSFPAVAVLIQHLVARRLGYRDRDEPSGILTHHLVQNPATWTFIEDLFEFLQRHPAAHFVGAGEIWKR